MQVQGIIAPFTPSPCMHGLDDFCPNAIRLHHSCMRCSGEETVSVIVAPITAGFTLASLGPPEAAAARFLSTIAAEGSGREATLLGTRAQEAEGLLFYEMEYVIKGAKFHRHNISVYTAR